MLPVFPKRQPKPSKPTMIWELTCAQYYVIFYYLTGLVPDNGQQRY